MNPQYGYYQACQPQITSQGRQRQQTYGGSNSTFRPGTQGYSRAAPTRTNSTYGYNNGQRFPVFSSPPNRNLQNSRSMIPQQSTRCGPNNNAQQYGRAVRPSYGNNMAYQQQAQVPQHQHPLAPAPNCTPQAIKVNVTADQLQNAKNAPIYPDRGESSMDGNPNVKYIQLNWQDLLGGMDNLRVSMAPSCEPGNPNNQLKVSFGGQKTDPPQAGETALRVVSIEPAATDRMNLQQGNAFAGAMKVCNPPTNMRMMPSTNQNSQRCFGGNCRR